MKWILFNYTFSIFQVSVGKFLTSCVFDLCTTGMSKSLLCKSVQSYADECRLKGVRTNWRAHTGCSEYILLGKTTICLHEENYF